MSRMNATPILVISSVSAYNVLKSFQKHWSGIASASNFTKAHDVKVCWIQFPCYGTAVPSILKHQLVHVCTSVWSTCCVFSPQKYNREQDYIMLLLGLFKLAVKNVSENCGSFNFCFKASTFKNLRLYLLPVFVPGLSPRFCPGNPLTHHSHATPRKALVL